MIVIVMGVSGCGKSTVGMQFAKTQAWPFYDADDFHPAENIAKMRSGVALNDDDRQGWLNQLAQLIQAHALENRAMVLACSALKQAYRTQLQGELSRVHFVYLKGDFATIQARLMQRQAHFMGTSLLQSQFDTLEEPTHGLTVPIDLSPAQQVAMMQKFLIDFNGLA